MSLETIKSPERKLNEQAAYAAYLRGLLKAVRIMESVQAGDDFAGRAISAIHMHVIHSTSDDAKE